MKLRQTINQILSFFVHLWEKYEYVKYASATHLLHSKVAYTEVTCCFASCLMRYIHPAGRERPSFFCKSQKIQVEKVSLNLQQVQETLLRKSVSGVPLLNHHLFWTRVTLNWNGILLQLLSQGGGVRRGKAGRKKHKTKPNQKESCICFQTVVSLVHF